MVPKNLTLLLVTIACIVLGAHRDSKTFNQLARSGRRVVKRDTIDYIIGSLKRLASSNSDLDTIKTLIDTNNERMQAYLSKISIDEMLSVLVKVNTYLDTEVEAGQFLPEMAQLMRTTVADLAKGRLDCPANGAPLKKSSLVGRDSETFNETEIIDNVIESLKAVASNNPDLGKVKETIDSTYERMRMYLSKISKDDMLTVVVKVNEYLNNEEKSGRISPEITQLISTTVADLAKDRVGKDCPANGVTSVKSSLVGTTVAVLLTCSWFTLR